MKWWLKCMRNYVNFRGRARRREFWMFTLFNTLVYLLLLAVGLVLLGAVIYKSESHKLHQAFCVKENKVIHQGMPVALDTDGNIEPYIPDASDCCGKEYSTDGHYDHEAVDRCGE